MQAEWAYQRPYTSNRERLEVLPGFLAYYNHRRPHGGIGGTTPASGCKQRPWELKLACKPERIENSIEFLFYVLKPIVGAMASSRYRLWPFLITKSRS